MNRLGCPTASSDTLYVNATNGSPGDGSTWGQAYAKLQDALLHACNCPNTDFNIWVAQGTYYPDEGVGRIDNDRDETFVLCDGIQLYGGFSGSGTETMLSERDWTTNVSILSGDIDNTPDSTNNSYHVVFAAFEDHTPTTRLDGFIITEGNANGIGSFTVSGQSFPRNIGGGIVTFRGTNTLTNNIIFRNTATNFGGGGSFLLGINMLTINEFSENSSLSGGGIYLTGINMLTNNTIIGNIASGGGGGIFTIFGNNTLTNNLISGNTANVDGGGILNDQGSHTLINNTIAGNKANGFGGGIYPRLANITMTNNIIWGNEANTYSGIFSEGSYFKVKNSIIQDGPVLCPTCPSTNGNIDPMFISPLLPSIAPTTGGNYRIQPSSPAINVGINDSIPMGITTDITGGPRILQDIVDLGAYEQIGCEKFQNFDISGPTSVCSGDSVILDAGTGFTSYSWSNGGGSSQMATFRNITSPTTFMVTVTDDNNCRDSVSFLVTPVLCTVSINDPCACLNNATTLQNGQFSDSIFVNAPTGQTWTVLDVVGLYEISSPSPPLAPTPIVIGTPLLEDPAGSGRYYLEGIHVDSLGYSITVFNGQGDTLRISNFCIYPTPRILLNTTIICENADPILLVGDPGDANIVEDSFTINGVLVTEIDPAVLGPGTHTINTQWMVV
jgi:hypothetical protein